MPDQTDDTSVTDNPDQSRFELHVSGTLAGRAEYRQRPDRLVLTHTEVDPIYQGQGLASQLAQVALNTARERGLQVTPLCPYIAEYIRRHPQYISIVDDRHRAQFTSTAEE